MFFKLVVIIAMASICLGRNTDDLPPHENEIERKPRQLEIVPSDIQGIGLRPSYCYLDKDHGPCNRSLLRYYYDRVTGSCETFIYGGCGGNKNNFVTKYSCLQHCEWA